MNAQEECIATNEEPRSGTRRRRLWDLPHKCHCPVIGVCFDTAELTVLMAKARLAVKGATDYELHTRAVGECAARSVLTERFQRLLEQRHCLTVRHFAAAKTTAALRDLWRTGRSGTEVAGVLWAAFTHPRCDEELTQEIYGDIHMLQHQVSNRGRAGTQALTELRRENAQLKRELDMNNGELTARLAQRNLELERTQLRLTEQESRCRGLETHATALLAQLKDAQSDTAVTQQLSHALQRAEIAEDRDKLLEATMAELKAELDTTREELACAENVLRWTSHAETTQQHAQDQAALCDRSVLCVGGKSHMVDIYRGLVERCGGRFLHHDGGLKDNAHRLESSLDGADAVICQAGCISHNAYWRVKNHCKRTGKQCVYLKSAGVTSFARGIAHVADPNAAAQNIQIEL